jgi:hypothetical protein
LNVDLYAVVNPAMYVKPDLAADDTTNVEVDYDTTGSVSTNNEAFQILGQKMEQMAMDYIPT